jgi:hypothetical protein
MAGHAPTKFYIASSVVIAIPSRQAGSTPSLAQAANKKPKGSAQALPFCIYEVGGKSGEIRHN